MSYDPTVPLRAIMRPAINKDALPKEELERRHGQVWTTEELRQQFEVIGFGAPLVIVRRRADGTEGSLFFQNMPRLYWGWKEDRV